MLRQARQGPEASIMPAWMGPVSRRLAQAVLAALMASLIVWILLPLAPGDPALRILMAQGIEEPNALQIAELRAELALDRPLPVQYLQWLGGVVQGDLSVSYRTGRPVLEEIGSRIPATALLLGSALAVSIVFSLCLALISVAWVGRWPDRAIRAYTQFTAAAPTFILALIVLQYVVVGMGVGSVLPSGYGWAVLLPALTVGLDRAGGWTQLLRANLLENIGSNAVHVARARGATRLRALLRYALPNSLFPYLTAIGVSIGALIGGSPLIEEIFTWPGVGRLVLQAISARDFPVIQGFVLLSALSYVTASLLVDLVGMWRDPRLREARG